MRDPVKMMISSQLTRYKRTVATKETVDRKGISVGKEEALDSNRNASSFE